MYRALGWGGSLRSSSRLTPRHGSLMRRRLLLVDVAAATPRNDLQKFFGHNNLRRHVEDQLIPYFLTLHHWHAMLRVRHDLLLLTCLAFH